MDMKELNQEDYKVNIYTKRLLELNDLTINQQKVILDYYDYLTNDRKIAVGTIYNYIKMLRMIAKAVKKDYNLISQEDIKSYIKGISNLADDTRWYRIVTLRLFFSWLGKKDIAEQLSKIPIKKKKYGRVKAENILTKEEIKLLIENATCLRNKVFIMVLYEMNCRLSECANLRLNDLKFDTDGCCEVIIRKGKTESSARIVYLIDSVSLLQQYLNEHPFYLKDKNSNMPLWYTIRDQSFQSKNKKYNTSGERYQQPCIEAWERVLKDTGKRAGIKKNVYPHLLRHSRTSHLIIDGMPLHLVKSQGGWSNIRTLDTIYSHICPQDLKNYHLTKNGKKPITEKINPLQNKVCWKCNKEVSFDKKFCPDCKIPLDISELINIKEKQDLKDSFINLIMQDPKIRDVVIDRMKEKKDVIELAKKLV